MIYEEALKEIDKMLSVALQNWDDPHDEYQTNTCYALVLAGKALEKQIPKQSSVKYNANPSLLYSECPVCDMTIQVGAKYCRYCGQALDWSNES